MDTLQKDLAYAVRSLARAPGMTLAAITCLALGIGATTTVFSATRALVLNPVPTGQSDQIVRVSELPPNAPADVDGVAPATFLEWERTAESFDRMAAWRWWNANLTGITESERVIGFQVTGRFFDLLDGRARIGRALSPADALPGAEKVVVLGEPLWKRRFASDPDVIGTVVRLNDEPHTVVGVLRDEFIFPPGAELWAPLSFTAADGLDRGSNRLHVFARLAAGVSAERASAELAASERRIAAEYPALRADWSAFAEPVQEARPPTTR
jgi:hypothetical protein